MGVDIDMASTRLTIEGGMHRRQKGYMVEGQDVIRRKQQVTCARGTGQWYALVAMICCASGGVIVGCDREAPSGRENGSVREDHIASREPARFFKAAARTDYGLQGASEDDETVQWNTRQPVLCRARPYITCENPRTVSVYVSVVGSGGYKVAQTERIIMHVSRDIGPEERREIEFAPRWADKQWGYWVQSGVRAGENAAGPEMQETAGRRKAPVDLRWRSMDGGWVIGEYGTQFEAEQRLIGEAAFRMNEYLEGMLEELRKKGVRSESAPSRQ